MAISKKQMRDAFASLKKAGYERAFSVMSDTASGGIHFQHKENIEKWFILNDKTINNLPT